MALVNGTPRSTLSNGSSKMPSVAKETAAMTRGPRTRRQHSLAKKREDNEQRSMLLQLNDDVLEKVLSFLEGRDLAVLETVCTHFRYGSWVAANRVAMPETSAKRKLESLELGEMPPGFRCEDGFLTLFAMRTTSARNALFPRHRPRGRDPIRDSSSAARPNRHHRRPISLAEPFVSAPRRPESAVRRHFDTPTSSRLFRKRGISPVCVLLATAASGSPPPATASSATHPSRPRPAARPTSRPRRKMKWSRKLAVVEERDVPLTPSNVNVGMWVRVKTDAEAVRKLCVGDGEEQDYAVGWEQGMDDTIGKPFPVGVVSRAYRKSPVVGLSVPNGLVAIAGGRYPTYGWYYPLEALEHV